MAKFTRIEVVTKMKDTGIVPLFYHEDIEVAKKVLDACYNAGARVFEFTNRGDFAHEVFGRLNKYAIVSLPEMALGIGSVVDVGTTSCYLQLGTNFVVTPVLREDIAKTCNRRKVLWSPGCGSPSEIAKAEELGCELVKLFPGDLYGPEFIQAIKGPQPWSTIMATGGVEPNERSLTQWFNAGATCVGLGSKLLSPEIIQSADYDLLERKVRVLMATAQKILHQ